MKNQANSINQANLKQNKKNAVQEFAKKAIVPVLIGANMLVGMNMYGQKKTSTDKNIQQVSAQINDGNSATIDPVNYGPSNPYIIPNLPNSSTMNLVIKTGAPVRAIISGADAGSLRLGTPDGRFLVDISNFDINKPGTRSLTYRENGAERAISMRVNYEVNLYDRTVNSMTQNGHPEIIWVDEGKKATISVGKDINPTGIEEAGTFRYEGSQSNLLSMGTTDSIKTVGKGMYIAKTIDGGVVGPSRGVSIDILAVVEKATIDQAAKTIKFPSTVKNVRMFVYKNVNGALTQVETFMGDGNPRTISGIENNTTYTIGAQLTDDTAISYSPGSLVTDFETDVNDIETKANSFKRHNRELSREGEVPVILYNISGQVMGTRAAENITIPNNIASGVYIVRYTENGEIYSQKISIK